MGKNKQAELDELLAKLQGWEDEDPSYLSDDMKELRHHVVIYRAKMEISG